jgi:hypothetical protein
MDASAWIALSAVAFSIGGSLITYGSLRQKVLDLERRTVALEAGGQARQSDREAVVRLEERMIHFQDTLNRMDDKLTAALSHKPPPVRRGAAK